MPVNDFKGKIGMFWRLKSNNVALQLSEKRIAKISDLERKYQISTGISVYSNNQFFYSTKTALSRTYLPQIIQVLV
jgi:hypothetical protein